MPDVGNMKDQFVVTCGHTGLPFQMCADDQQTKLEWILAIKKVGTNKKWMETLYKGADVVNNSKTLWLKS